MFDFNFEWIIYNSAIYTNPFYSSISNMDKTGSFTEGSLNMFIALVIIFFFWCAVTDYSNILETHTKKSLID